MQVMCGSIYNVFEVFIIKGMPSFIYIELGLSTCRGIDYYDIFLEVFCSLIPRNIYKLFNTAANC